LDSDHEDVLQRQKDAITKTLNSEMIRALKAKDAEMCRQPTEARDREELLKLQVRASVRAGRDAAGCEQSGANSGRLQKLQHEATALRLRNKQVEERMQVTCSVTARLTAELVKSRSHDWCFWQMRQ
jgi:hypothetical protein